MFTVKLPLRCCRNRFLDHLSGIAFYLIILTFLSVMSNPDIQKQQCVRALTVMFGVHRWRMCLCLFVYDMYNTKCPTVTPIEVCVNEYP